MSGILRFSEAVSIGLHALGVLAHQPKKAMTGKEIASRIGASEAHLAKVLQRLVRAGIIESVRGPKGGFYCDARAMERSLLDVYEAVDGPFRETKCLLRSPVCEGKECVFGGLIDECDSRIRNYLENTCVRDIAGILKGVSGDSKKDNKD